MIIYANYEEHLVLLPLKITKEKFLEKAKVKPKSYFYRRLGSIYIALTTSITDLEEEYTNYYNEYDNFNDFLYHKYPYLSEKKLDYICTRTKSKRYKLFRGYMNRMMDYNLVNLLEYPEEFSEKVNELLKAESYED